MEKLAAYAISAFIIGFGLWILVAGLSSTSVLLVLRRFNSHSDRALERFGPS